MAKLMFGIAIINTVVGILVCTAVAWTLHEVTHAGNLAFVASILLLLFGLSNLSICVYKRVIKTEEN